MKEKTIFDYLNAIFYKKDIPYDKKICNSYLLSLWLSHDKNLVDITNDINKYQFLLSDEILYKYYFNSVPAGKRYIKWVKKEETDKSKKEKMEEIRNDMMLSKKEFSNFFLLTNKMKNVNIKNMKNKENASSVFLK